MWGRCEDINPRLDHTNHLSVRMEDMELFIIQLPSADYKHFSFEISLFGEVSEYH